jgi:hypothetical protein
MCGGGSTGALIAAEAAWWLDRLNVGEIEFADRAQRLGGGGVLGLSPIGLRGMVNSEA